MNIAEALVGLLAPHTCLRCGKEGDLVCSSCASSQLLPPLPRCYRCNRPSDYFRTCWVCRNDISEAISHVWTASQYIGLSRQLIKVLKFRRAMAASKLVAACIDLSLPPIPSGTIIVAVPTANKRIRMRGYDQAYLIAKNLARRRHLKCTPVLHRRGAVRQVGANRDQRKAHLKHVFYLGSKADIKGHNFLLIDDVLTTGATLEAAAAILYEHGAHQVNAAVFAH